MEDKFKILNATQVVTGSKHRTTIIIAVMIVIVLLWVGFWYWSKNKTEISESPVAGTEAVPKTIEPKELQKNVGGGLGASIYDKSQNPIVDKLSEINPFGKAPINPLKAVYNNPFE